MLSRKEWLDELESDIDPEKLAGEGFFATEEYPRAADIDNPYVRGDVGREGEYYPPKARRRHTDFTPR